MLGRRRPRTLNVPLARRNLYWASVVNDLIMSDVDLQRQIPDNAHIVVLPVDDPDLYRHNLVLRSRIAEGVPVLLVEVRREKDAVCVQPLQSLAASRVAAPQMAYA